LVGRVNRFPETIEDGTVLKSWEFEHGTPATHEVRAPVARWLNADVGEIYCRLFVDASVRVSLDMPASAKAIMS
ncbi:MAG: hypothetical protein WCL32_22250, partial [Planctomycetota bacterium]